MMQPTSPTEQTAEVMPLISNAQPLTRASLNEEMDKFCFRFKSETTRFIENAYGMIRELYCSPKSGCLSTSIAEDVLALLRMQYEVVSEYLMEHELESTREGRDMLIDCIVSFFRSVRKTQTNLLPIFVSSLEQCCAAANDFYRLANKIEVFLDEVLQDHEFLRTEDDDKSPYAAVRLEGAETVSAVSQDAVYAAERVQVFFIRKLNQTSVPSDYFSYAWEDTWTHNDVTLELLHHLDVMLPHVETYLESDLLYHKVLVSACRAVVCFYIRCLVEKADSVSRRRRSKPRLRRASDHGAFSNPKRALRRMQDDIGMMQQYFGERAGDNVALSRILADELRMLELIYECLASPDSDSLETFIVVLHKRTGADKLVTRYFVGDLWVMVAGDSDRKDEVAGVISGLEPDLEMVSKGMQERAVSSSSDLAFLHLDEMLKVMYEERITQGILPMCWACVPKTVGEEGREAVPAKLRKLTRRLVELPARKSPPPAPKQVNVPQID